MSRPTAPPPDRPQHRRVDEPTRSVDLFLDHPTLEVEDWRWLWTRDVEFPIRSHRGGLAGKLLVAVKKLLRPLAKLPLGDLHDRQRTFNVVLLHHLEHLSHLAQRQAERIETLDAFVREALDEALSHNDALYARADQKLDRYRAEAHDLAATLDAALLAAGVRDGAEDGARPGVAEEVRSREATPKGGEATADPRVALRSALDERAYLELERRYRGSEEDVRQRLAVYRPYLEAVPAGKPVLDLGCGRGEALEMLEEAGLAARGVDSNARMAARCRERGLAAAEGDLFETLAAAEEGSLGGVVSFHVIEHLPPDAVARLVHLAWRALAPGGVLVLETPNPLSVVVAARSFWLDPTHVRPVHPDTLRLRYELAGFDRIEHLELRPFSPRDRLPEIDLSTLAEHQRDLADRVNRLRDRLDEVLFGYQDYALVGVKAGGQSPADGTSRAERKSPAKGKSRAEGRSPLEGTGEGRKGPTGNGERTGQGD